MRFSFIIRDFHESQKPRGRERNEAGRTVKRYFGPRLSTGHCFFYSEVLHPQIGVECEADRYAAGNLKPLSRAEFEARGEKEVV